MNRVSTAGMYTLTLANLTDTQQRQLEASRQVSSQKVAQDLKGYAKKAETLTSLRNLQIKVGGLLDQNAVLTDRFSTQDVAMNQVADAALAARDAINAALASDRVDTLMSEMSGAFANVVQGLNSKSQGRYIFGGGQVDTTPVSATSMSDLTIAPIASYFHNDTFKPANQIDENSSVNGSVLADALATPLFTAFQSVQTMEEGVNGPFTGAMTAAQRTFLETAATNFDNIRKTLTNEAAKNGSVLKRLENAQTELSGRSDMLEGMTADIAQVNMPEAISRLQLAQFAVQASAQVFNTLRDSSLLNYLR
jgi:flagellar hook-associated protein 3 FlgL